MFVAFKASAQTYTLNYDSIRVGKTPNSSVLIPKDIYFKGLPKGNLSIRADGKVIKNDTIYYRATDTVSTLQTIANFFPKGDTRYYTKSQINSGFVPYTGATSNVTLGNHNWSASDGTNSFTISPNAGTLITASGNISVRKAGTMFEGSAVEALGLTIRNSSDNAMTYLSYNRTQINNKLPGGIDYSYTFPLRTGTFSLTGSVPNRDSLVYSKGKTFQQIAGIIAPQGISMYDTGSSLDAGNISSSKVIIGATVSDRRRSVDYYTGYNRDWALGERASKNFTLDRFDGSGNLVDSVVNFSFLTGSATFRAPIFNQNTNTGAAGTDSVLVKSSTGEIKRIAANYYATAAGAGSVTSVATGYGLSGGPITSTGTISADTTLLRTVLNSFSKAQSDARYVNLIGSYANPSWVTSLDRDKITGFTPGQIMFGALTGQTGQSGALYWDSTNKFFGINSGTSPTHSLTFGSVSTGIAMYNTSDQITDYERGVLKWGSNEFFVGTEYGGAATARVARFGVAAVAGANLNRTLTVSPSMPFFSFTWGNTSLTGVAVNLGGGQSFSGSSGMQAFSGIGGTVNQSGTAGYRGQWIAIYEQATGSGNSYLADYGTTTAANYTGTYNRRFSVNTSGTIFSNSLTASTLLSSDASKNIVSTTTGTGVLAALGVNIGSAGSPVLFNGALGTPSSGVATNLTGTASGLTAGAVTNGAYVNAANTFTGGNQVIQGYAHAIFASTPTGNPSTYAVNGGTKYNTTHDGTTNYFEIHSGGLRKDVSGSVYSYSFPDRSMDIAGTSGTLTSGALSKFDSNGNLVVATAGTDYQAPLVSATNIKTINGSSLLGSGDLAIFYAGSISVAATAQTTFTVPIGATMPNLAYKVNVTPTSSLNSPITFFVDNKTNTTFDVTYATPLTGPVKFDWSVFP